MVGVTSTSEASQIVRERVASFLAPSHKHHGHQRVRRVEMAVIRMKVSMRGDVKLLKDPPILLIEVRQLFRPIGQQDDVRSTERIRG